MKWVFWLSAATVAYAYLGYPLLLWLRSRWRRRPVRSGPFLPPVSIIIAVRNESTVIAEKLRNLAELDYPADCVEVVVVSDGSRITPVTACGRTHNTATVMALLNLPTRRRVAWAR